MKKLIVQGFVLRQHSSPNSTKKLCKKNYFIGCHGAHFSRILCKTYPQSTHTSKGKIRTPSSVLHNTLVELIQ